MSSRLSSSLVAASAGTAVSLSNYVVQSGDTLRLIAAQVLGDAAQWQAIARASGLRSPYISARPGDQYGTPLASITLTATLPAGALALTLTGVPAYVLAVGNVIYLETSTATGQLTGDALQLTASGGLAVSWARIARWSSLQRTLVVLPQTGTSRDYPAGTTLQVFGNPLVQTTAVAQPQETIVVPVPRGGDVAIDTIVGTQTGVGGTLSHLGTDLLLDATFAHQVGPVGDFATVTGRPNVAQALMVRVTTELGTFERHLEYGSRHSDLIGQQNGPYLELAFAHYLTECLQRDPRVFGVQASALPQDTTLAGAAEITLKETSGLVSFSNLLLNPAAVSETTAAPASDAPSLVTYGSAVYGASPYTAGVPVVAPEARVLATYGTARYTTTVYS